MEEGSVIYGHDEAMRDLDLHTWGRWAERMARLAAYITRLEAADTRLLVAAEAVVDSYCDFDIEVESHAMDELRAAIEAAKQPKPSERDTIAALVTTMTRVADMLAQSFGGCTEELMLRAAVQRTEGAR